MPTTIEDDIKLPPIAAPPSRPAQPPGRPSKPPPRWDLFKFGANSGHYLEPTSLVSKST